MYPVSHQGNKLTTWRYVRRYSLCRLIFAVALLAIGKVNHTLSQWADLFTPSQIPVLSLVIVAALALVVAACKRQNLSLFIHVTFALDILLLGSLLVLDSYYLSAMIAMHITIAAMAIAMRPVISLSYTLVGISILLAPYYYGFSFVAQGASNFTLYLVTTFTVYVAASAIGFVARRRFNALAILNQQKYGDARSGNWNSQAVDKLDIGVAVLDDTLHIRQINNSALRMIGNLITDNRLRGELALRLINVVNTDSATKMTTKASNQLLLINAFPSSDGLFLTIENKTDTADQVRNTTLPSVGRTAMSIAHEIRNPLNAINHAAQLLTPMDGSDNDFSSLLTKIKDNANRIDSVVDSVVTSSRAGLVAPGVIDLRPWLRDFALSFDAKSLGKQIDFNIVGESIRVQFDPVQFEQIISRLCQNIVEQSISVNTDIELRFTMATDGLMKPYLEIWDFGKSLDEAKRRKIFEPFQTTEIENLDSEDISKVDKKNDSNVEFYLAKEICDANGAHISYINQANRSGFRMTFQLPSSD